MPPGRGSCGRTSSRRRTRSIASGAASCPSWPRASTCATSAASSRRALGEASVGWTDLGAIAVTQGPGLRRLAARRRVVRQVDRLVARHSARARASSGRPHRVARPAARRAAAARRGAGRLRRPHQPVFRPRAGPLRAHRRARATMRRGRRTTRWRSCSASAIRAGRSSTGWRSRATIARIAFRVPRMTHADRNQPRRDGAARPAAAERRAQRRFQLQRAEDGGDARWCSRDRGRASRRDPRPTSIADATSPTSRVSFQRVVVESLLDRTFEAARWLGAQERRDCGRRVGEQPAARRRRGARREGSACRCSSRRSRCRPTTPR